MEPIVSHGSIRGRVVAPTLFLCEMYTHRAGAKGGPAFLLPVCLCSSPAAPQTHWCWKKSCASPAVAQKVPWKESPCSARVHVCMCRARSKKRCNWSEQKFETDFLLVANQNPSEWVQDERLCWQEAAALRGWARSLDVLRIKLRPDWPRSELGIWLLDVNDNFLKYLWKIFFPCTIFYWTKLKEQNVILNLSDSIGTNQKKPDFMAAIHRRETTALRSPHLFL